MYVCPRLTKIVPDLAEMCYTIHLFRFAARIGLLTVEKRIKVITIKFAVNILGWAVVFRLFQLAHTVC